MKTLSLLIAAAIVLSGCSKENTTVTPTTSSNTGTIKFVNQSNNPYYIFVDGASKGEMSGNSSKDFTVSYGLYKCRVLQKSGYALYPTDKSYSGEVKQGQNIVVTFP